MAAKELNLGGDAPRGGDCGSGREQFGTPPTIHSSGTAVVNPVTGQRVIQVRRGTFQQIEASVTLRHPEAVIGEKLTAKLDSTGLMIDFRWVRMEPTDEADARDVQSRAGWSDTGYGFYGFEFKNGIATWSCSRTCE